jgi:hypothetical protein
VCGKHIGYDAPFYQRIGPQTRRVMSVAHVVCFEAWVAAEMKLEKFYLDKLPDVFATTPTKG